MTGLFLLLPLLCAQEEKPRIRIGSKAFPESSILAEIIAQITEQVGEAEPERHFGMGGTMLLYEALKNGDLDIYPEYTGTILRAIAKREASFDPELINHLPELRGLQVSRPLGFNNSYGIAMLESTAGKLGLRKVSDLADHPELKCAFSTEFIKRDDGWQALERHYGLQMHNVTGIEHALAYEAVANGTIDVMDVYTTDGKIARYNLRILEDDRGFFPKYYGVLFFRKDFPERFPKTYARLSSLLVGGIDDATMVRLNSMVEVEQRTYEAAALHFLATAGQKTTARAERPGFWRTLADADIPQHLVEHLVLVGISLGLAILAGLPLGVVALRHARLQELVLASTEIVQTIPSLAMFAGLVALGFGIGQPSAILALFLFSLLPIVRSTYTGLKNIDPRLLESADALGLSPWERLREIELPLASRNIMAGIKIASVINVGTATLGALVGAKGLGVPIIEGLTLLRPGLILAGVMPAILLALLVRGFFELLEWWVVPRGLRLTRA